MLMIYLGIARSEKANKKYDFARSASKNMTHLGSSTEYDIRNPQKNAQSARATVPRRHNRKNSRRFAHQASLYVIFFFLTWIFSTMSASLQAFQNKVYSPIMILVVIFSPLQVFFNAIIYLRPRYLHFREENTGRSTVALLRLCLLAPASQSGSARHLNIMSARKGSHEQEHQNSGSDNETGPVAATDGEKLDSNAMEKLDKKSTDPMDDDIEQSLHFVGQCPKSTADEEVETGMTTGQAYIDPTTHAIATLEEQLPHNDRLADDEEGSDDDDEGYLD